MGALAIAAVSAVLKDLLNNGLIDAQLSTDVSVRVGPPPAQDGNGTGATQLNLFLYQVAPNLSWRNEGLPSRNAQGDRVSRAPLALDLHYLLTAYGAAEFEAEILLGYAMQLLHENAILSRGAIRRTFSASTGVSGSILPSSFQALAAAGLSEQVELIKITPQYLDTEAMSRIWSALQTHYRTSTAYHVSVVLIESQESSRSAPPVLEHRIFAIPLQSPLIERVEPQVVGLGETISLRGQSLRGNVTQAAFGNEAIAPLMLPVNPADELSDRLIQVPLPAGLLAGVNTVQILHPLDLKTPNEPHRGIESNLAAFILQPAIVQTADAETSGFAMGFLPTEAELEAALPADADRDANRAVRDRLTRVVSLPAVWLQVAPAVVGNQRMALLLNETPLPGNRPPRAYSFSDPALLIAAAEIPVGQTAAELAPPDQRSDRLVFSLSGVVPGDYLVRVRVAGADSALRRSPPVTADQPLTAFGSPVLAITGDVP
jgi:hypothetical protein